MTKGLWHCSGAKDLLSYHTCPSTNVTSTCLNASIAHVTSIYLSACIAHASIEHTYLSHIYLSDMHLSHIYLSACLRVCVHRMHRMHHLHLWCVFISGVCASVVCVHLWCVCMCGVGASCSLCACLCVSQAPPASVSLTLSHTLFHSLRFLYLKLSMYV